MTVTVNREISGGRSSGGSGSTDAADINIVDAGTYYTGTEVETALQEIGVDITALSAAGVADGDKGDITVSGTGTVWTIDSGVISGAARTVLDDASVSAMVDTLGGASSSGTGGLVRTNSPTLVTPNLGTPSAITLTNATGLPTSGITGYTTVATDPIFNAVGDLPVGSGVDTAARLASGTSLQVLRVNSTETGLEWVDPTAIADSTTQFGVVHAGLMPNAVRVTATGAPAGYSTPCIVESIMCITVGTGGPVQIHDDSDAATAAQLRFTRAVGDMVAGTVYPLAGDGAAVVFTNGIYFTNSTSGVYIINAVPEV